MSTAKKTNSKNKKTMKKKDSGKLYTLFSNKNIEKVGDSPTDIVEQIVSHSEDGLYGKLYEKKNGVITKTIVKSSGNGGEYTLTVRVGNNESKTSTYNKKELLSKLKENENLNFMTKYINSQKLLSRQKPKKTASKKTASKKTASKKTASKKTASKKTASKKTASKKTASKKTPAKKTASKKTATKKSASKKK